MNNPMSIGEIIYTNRKKVGISQEELADMLNVTRQSISLWETDQTVPSTANLVRLTEIFNISMDELCGKESKTNPPPTLPEDDKNTTSASDDEQLKPTCIAQVQTVYDHALLKSACNAALKKFRVLSIVAIIISVFMIIGIITANFFFTVSVIDDFYVIIV